jgi:adenylylsulfate kinase
MQPPAIPPQPLCEPCPLNRPNAYGNLVEYGLAPLESNSRSIAKAVSYRVLGSSATAVIGFILTRRVALSAELGVLDMVLKIGLYFLHERLWNHISFGRSKRPEYEI